MRYLNLKTIYFKKLISVKLNILNKQTTKNPYFYLYFLKII